MLLESICHWGMAFHSPPAVALDAVWPFTRSQPGGAVVRKPGMIIPAGMGTVDSWTQVPFWYTHNEPSDRFLYMSPGEAAPEGFPVPWRKLEPIRSPLTVRSPDTPMLPAVRLATTSRLSCTRKVLV